MACLWEWYGQLHAAHIAHYALQLLQLMWWTLCAGLQTANILRQTWHTFTSVSSASRLMGTFLCDISPSR